MEHADRIFSANGCDRCRHTGYEGRTAIFEIAMVSDRMQDLITQRKSSALMKSLAIDEGMMPLRRIRLGKSRRWHHDGRGSVARDHGGRGHVWTNKSDAEVCLSGRQIHGRADFR